jgi:flagellin
MRAQIRSYTVASRNAQDGLSLAQTAEGALDEASQLLSRMRELAMQAANGTYSDEDRVVIDEEFQAALLEIDRISSETDFNGINLLDGTFTGIDVQVGVELNDIITLTMEDTSSTSLAIDAEDVLSQANAVASLDVLDTAIDSVNRTRGTIGAQSNRLQSAMRSILNARESLSSSESRIRDVDVASESADLTRNSIMQQAAVSVLQQANVQPQIALSLLQG